MLHLYNSLTQQKEAFSPLDLSQVGLYVCGMTVYDYCHVGHARIWVVFDILNRYLRELGYKVNYIRNITDIDDKIIQRAQASHQTIGMLTARMISAMQEDAEALSILPPTHEPRATDCIPAIIRLIQTLLDKDYAYLTASGDVYYAIKRFQAYGQLAQQSLEALMQGVRVNIDSDKQHPLDFALWKGAKPGEPSWDAPWGKGRPGWHIECSTMAMQHLGASFDIHGGGADLRFPHHQNEIAQSEAATGKRFVRYWMHVGFVQVNDEKMSKSKGNTLTVKALRAQYPAEVIRYFLLSSHYRSPINYTTTHLNQAHTALKRLYSALRYKISHDVDPTIVANYEHVFRSAMEDDLNTPVALSVLFDIAHEINRTLGKAPERMSALLALLKKLGGLLGLLQEVPEQFLSTGQQRKDADWIRHQISLRENARANKQWALADTIRKELLAAGIVLEDTSQGTRWY